MNPLLLMDGYKTDHRRQYPDGTQYVYSNLTPRNQKSQTPVRGRTRRRMISC